MLSLIIPIYNVDPWISACLETLPDTSSLPCEAIFIIQPDPEGSWHQSLEIINSFTAPNIAIKVHTLPARVSIGEARNIGLGLSSGNFISFVDPDDLMVLGSHQKMVSLLQSSGADLVIGDHLEFADGQLPKQRQASSEFLANCQDGSKLFKLSDLGELAFLDRNFLVVWGKVYRRSFLEEVLGKESLDQAFLPLSMTEDTEFLRRMLVSGARISFYPEIVYFYRRRDGSAVHSRSMAVYDLLTSFQSSLTFSWPSEELYAQNLLAFYRAWWFHLVRNCPFNKLLDFYGAGHSAFVPHKAALLPELRFGQRFCFWVLEISGKSRFSLAIGLFVHFCLSGFRPLAWWLLIKILEALNRILPAQTKEALAVKIDEMNSSVPGFNRLHRWIDRAKVILCY